MIAVADRGGTVMRYFLLLFLCLSALPCHGQTVQKCVDADGNVTLTSHACPSGQAETGSYDAKPERVTPDQRRRQTELTRWQRQQDAQRGARGTFEAPQIRSSSQSRHDRCAAARRWRDAEIERVGLKRTHAMLRSWDDYVYQQCK